MFAVLSAGENENSSRRVYVSFKLHRTANIIIIMSMETVKPLINRRACCHHSRSKLSRILLCRTARGRAHLYNRSKKNHILVLSCILWVNRHRHPFRAGYRAFSYDVTAAILVFHHKETAAYWCTKPFHQELNSIFM